MATIAEMIKLAERDGYYGDNATAKVCQDVVLKALSESDLCRNATIKGGVVMRSITGNARRATQDMDIDFIRYSLSDDSIKDFISKLNCLKGLYITPIGELKELRQQDYHGKRVYIRISDDSGDYIESKIDLGVHKDLSIEPKEYSFDIASFDDGASLLINSNEQIFAEKLKSLLRFGQASTRYKDVFDLYYLSNHVDKAKLRDFIGIIILNNDNIKQKSMTEIYYRVEKIFSSDRYLKRLGNAKNNWIDEDVFTVTTSLLGFLKSIIE